MTLPEKSAPKEIEGVVEFRIDTYSQAGRWMVGDRNLSTLLHGLNGCRVKITLQVLEDTLNDNPG